MTTLENSYCVPNNSQWEELIGYAPDRDTVICAVYDAEMGILDANANEVEYLTEIPVSRFQDLLHDRIVPWRLEEVGFVDPFKTTRRRMLTEFHIIDVDEQNVVRIDGGYTYITTFTDLITLIRMLTPPTEKT